MGRLIIVAGAGGAGKSFFLRKWCDYDRKNAVKIKKFVSDHREPREIELRTGNSDLIFAKKYDPKTPEGLKWLSDKYPNLEVNLGDLEFHSNQYSPCDAKEYNIYQYGDAYYEVDIKNIDNALNEGKNPIVIVRKCNTIKKLLGIYPNALLIYVQSILSGNDLVEKLVSLGESSEDARKRESRNKNDLLDYMQNIQELPKTLRVVINDFDNSRDSAIVEQIKDIYTEEIENYHLIEKSIFIIQSYTDLLKKEHYFSAVEKAYKLCFETKESNVKQADHCKDGSYMIGENVFKMLDECDCAICDITPDQCSNCEHKKQGIPLNLYQGVSRNVMLELGYILNKNRQRGIDIGKRLIITMNHAYKHDVTIPVDIQGINVIYYNSEPDLTLQLIECLKSIYK